MTQLIKSIGEVYLFTIDLFLALPIISWHDLSEHKRYSVWRFLREKLESVAVIMADNF